MKKSNKTITDILLLVIVTIITYFPVSFFLFSLKNDSLVQYLPFRYHLSESIQHGYFPFWSPYLYTGFPIHADMQGMTWNPIVLIISLFTRYNMSVLEFEVTIYLVLAAVGMYGLLKSFKLNRVICLVGAISYMSCGFINGSASVIPWISSAAFIPFVFTSLKYFLEKQTLKNALLFSIALSMLFLCGYPTFFIYTCYLLIAILITALIFARHNSGTWLNPKTIGLFILSTVVFALVCSPAIISYIEFLPYFSRGAGITAAKASENPFTLYSSLSFLLPNAVNKEHVWLNTDPSMRNSYVGLFVFALAALSIFYKMNRWQLFILVVTVVSFVLSLGSLTPVHKLFYTILPGFNTFRHPGNIRLFSSIGIILLAAIFLNRFLSDAGKNRIQKMVNVLYMLAGILILPVIYALFFESGVVSNIIDAIKTKQPKSFLDTLRFPSMLLIQGMLQLAFTGLVIFLLKRERINKKILASVFAINSLLFCWFALPFNFISQIRTKAVNNYVASFPDGYPLPDINEPVGANIISDSTTFPIYGYPNFYSKKISIQDYVITPTLNKSYEKFNGDKKLRSLMADYPFAWLNDTIFTSTPTSIPGKKFSIFTFNNYNLNDYGGTPKPGSADGSILLKKFNPNQFTFSVTSRQTSVLSVFQQYNDNWTVTVNGNEATAMILNYAFMGTYVPAGTSEVEFKYRPRMVILAAWLSVITIFLILSYFIFFFIRNRKR